MLLTRPSMAFSLMFALISDERDGTGTRYRLTSMECSRSAQEEKNDACIAVSCLNQVKKTKKTTWSCFPHLQIKNQRRRMEMVEIM